jgi:hypothetical protein
MLFTNPDSMFAFLKENYENNPRPVSIASYNMYLGISNGKDWSKKYPSSARSFINVLDPSHTRIILGIPPLVECKDDCADCRTKYNKLLQRFIDTKEELGMNLRFSNASHLKMYAIGNLVVSGGINLTTSEFTDATFTVDSGHVDPLMDLFNKHWKAADLSIDGLRPGKVEEA